LGQLQYIKTKAYHDDDRGKRDKEERGVWQNYIVSYLIPFPGNGEER
jgi:hypothetical protein